MRMKKTLIIITLLVGTVTVSAQTSGEIDKQEQYKTEVRAKLQLDYTLPDYSTSRIDAKVMGTRLAKILKSICDNYHQYTNLSALSVIQSSQVSQLM